MNAKTNALNGKQNGLITHGMNAGVVGKSPVLTNVMAAGKLTAKKKQTLAGRAVKDVTTL